MDISEAERLRKAIVVMGLKHQKFDIKNKPQLTLCKYTWIVSASTIQVRITRSSVSTLVHAVVDTSLECEGTSGIPQGEHLRKNLTKGY